ncbi:hypothetical protein G6F26_013548 [Rhizopus arrhizus]|nr:hypothetical protein G6F26_013548 [Rhizopus arrhizus]KAG1082560.1 hypothetical protein G6F39_013611 [Rhizopus arrhizus]
MVALAHFLIDGKSALINMERRDDQTIQTLYRIAKRIISPEIVKEETNSAAFEELYFCAFDGLNRTKEILLENQNIETTTKRAIDCLDDHMTALNEIHRKRFAATSSDPTGTITPDHATALTTISSETNVVSTSSPVNVSTMPIKENDTTLTQSTSAPTSSSSHDILTASSSAAIMPNASTVSTPISTRGTTRDLKRRMQQENWEFVDAYRTEHGSNMDWEQCFVQGKEKGLFQQYTTAKSAKAAYFRYKW